MSRKPGMAKYASFRGPLGSLEARIAWWEDDMARERQTLVAAQEAGDARLVRLAQRDIKRAQATLNDLRTQT